MYKACKVWRFLLEPINQTIHADAGRLINEPCGHQLEGISCTLGQGGALSAGTMFSYSNLL